MNAQSSRWQRRGWLSTVSPFKKSMEKTYDVTGTKVPSSTRRILRRFGSPPPETSKTGRNGGVFRRER